MRLTLITNPDEPERSPRRAALSEAPPLREQDDFDRLMDAEARRLSPVHWTPTAVCHRAAQLLALSEGERMLDVGSGVGKLCVLGSLITHGQYVGVEQRLPLVSQARRLAAQVSSTAQFVHGDAFALDWNGFDAFYFYNPFDEARFPPGWHIDSTIALGAEIFNRLVLQTQQRLAQLAAGTRVVTFHGIGGPMPDCFELLVSERIADGTIELWMRAQSSSGRC